MFQRVFALAAILGLPFAGPIAAHDGHDHSKEAPAAQYRIAIMEALGADAVAIGTMIKHNLPQTQSLPFLADAIAANAKAAIPAFEAKVASKGAKPKVWENWADFSARFNQLAANAEDAAKAARDQSPDARKKLEVMLSACKNCHDEYRNK